LLNPEEDEDGDAFAVFGGEFDGGHGAECGLRGCAAVAVWSVVVEKL
jgi:hypothetical protein